MKKRKRIFLWTALSAALAASATVWVLGSDRSARPLLETAPVEFGDLTLELPATGSIDAVNVVEVGSPISGRIDGIFVDFNQPVKAGQLLAKIDESDFRATWVQAEADVAAAKAAVEVSASGLESAKSDLNRAIASAERAKAVYTNAAAERERQQKLLAAELTTQSQFDQTEAVYKNAKADLESSNALIEQARARIKSAQAMIEQAKAMVDMRAARAAQTKRNLDYCRITSPVDGVVVSRDVDVGQTVAARLQAPALFHIAEDLSDMYVYTKLDSSDVAKVRPGLAATFTVNAYPGETFEGKLVEVRINPNPEAPVSRAAPVGQIQRTISAGVTASSTAESDLSNTSTSGGGSGGSSSSKSSASNPGLPTTTTTASSPSGAPPTAKRNTVVVYDALIQFHNPDRKLLPGMTAYVTIPLNSIQDKLKVPSAALRFTPKIPDGEKQRLLNESQIPAGSSVVWVVTGERTYRPVAVKPVLTDYVYTAVDSVELKPGMRVATRSG